MMRKIDITSLKQKNDFLFKITKATVNEDFEVHTHSFTELVIILGGEGTHIVGEQEFSLNAGDVFVINGNNFHGLKNLSNLQLCNLAFDMKIFASNMSDLKKLAGFQSLFIFEPFYRSHHEFKSKLILDSQGLLHTDIMLELMLKEFNSNQEGSYIALKMHFLSLITYLSQLYTGERNSYTQEVFLLGEVISFLENNYTQPIRVRDLSERAHLSERHFNRIFTQNYHETPMEYILQLRLKHAQRLLKNSDLTISQIAVESGFYDISAFSKRFKLKFGVSPGEYRRFSLQ